METKNAPGPSKSPKDEDKEENPMFECNICLDTAKDAVVSYCGHLFCWPCLHQWLETRPVKQLCPVCKAAISKDKVIPLYGRGSKQQEDPSTSSLAVALPWASAFDVKTSSSGRSRSTTPRSPTVQQQPVITDSPNRNKVPPRPAGQRTEPENTGFGSQGFPGFGFGDGGFHMSFGIGAFPFGFITSTFNGGHEQRPHMFQDRGAVNPEDEILSKMFLYVAITIFLWLLIA